MGINFLLQTKFQLYIRQTANEKTTIISPAVYKFGRIGTSSIEYYINGCVEFEAHAQ